LAPNAQYQASPSHSELDNHERKIRSDMEWLLRENNARVKSNNRTALPICYGKEGERNVS